MVGLSLGLAALVSRRCGTRSACASLRVLASLLERAGSRP